MGSLSLLQGIFPTQGSNPGLLHCRQFLYQQSHKGSPRMLECIAYRFSSRSSQPRNQTGVSCIAGRFFTNWAISEAQVLKYLCPNAGLPGLFVVNIWYQEVSCREQNKELKTRTKGGFMYDRNQFDFREIIQACLNVFQPKQNKQSFDSLSASRCGYIFYPPQSQTTK